MPPCRSVVLCTALVLSTLNAPRHLAAQADTSKVMISGTVIDPSRHPIEGAEVRVVGTAASVMSSPMGTFRLYGKRGKELLVQIRRPGYRAQLIKLTGDWSGTVLLEPGTFELPEIQVTARWAKPARYAGTTKYDDYFRRRRQGLGLFINREEIEIRNPLQTVEIFQGRPGVKTGVQPIGVMGGSVLMFSRCSGIPPLVNVYVDGRKQYPDTPAPGTAWEIATQLKAVAGQMVNQVNPADIEFVEIFRGPGELPPEFNDGNCGAIAIWTRQGGR
jgi:hypothetical protein